MKLIKTALAEAAEYLQESSDSPRLDAEVLLAFALNMRRSRLLVEGGQALNSEAEGKFLALLERRKKHEPVAYICGQKEFWSLDFVVSPAVLIPRPETELLVEHALTAALTCPGALQILELGTGSGCISVALAYELRKARKQVSVLAVDRSADALCVAQQNASRHSLQDCIEFRISDWYSAVKPGETFHLILSNPPYIADNDKRMSPETRYEPQMALFAGPGGLEQVEKIITGAKSRLHPGGLLLIEFGFDQGACLQKKFPGCIIHRDYQQNDRLLEYRESLIEGGS